MTKHIISKRFDIRAGAAWALGGCAIAAAGSGPALAQAVVAPPARSSQAGPKLEEVIVTAQRKKQTLEAAPVAVTYISPATTKNLDIRSVHSLGLITPSFSFSAQDDYAQIFIRGIGTNYANPGLETPVAIYQDDVYQTAGNNNVLNLMDPESVQVLAGPQGSLYGRNASGGVVLFNTADPTHKQQATIEGEYGRFNHQQVDLMINQPLGPDLAFRVAARFQNNDGYIHNEYDGKTLGGDQTKQVRAKLLYTPSAIPGLSILAAVDYSYTDEHHDYSHERLSGAECLGCAFGAVPPDGYYNVNQNGDGAFILKNTLATLHITYDVGPYTFKSVTGYRDFQFGGPGGSDQDYTTVNFFQFHDRVPGQTLSESLSMTTNYAGPLNFIAGYDYLRDRRSFYSQFEGIAFALPEQIPAYVGTVPQNGSSVRSDSNSAFIEANYKVTKDLTFTAGARYNIDERWLDTQNNPLAAFIFGNSGFDQHVKYYSFTPRGVIQYNTPIGNLYVSETKGFKAGGVNTPAFSEAPAIAPEKIRSEEIGLKSRLMAGRLQTSIDGFHYDDEDLQVQVTDVLAGGSVTKNAAAAEGYGIEASARFAATEDLILGAGFDWLHARFTSFPDASLYCVNGTGAALPGGLGSCPPAQSNLAGTPLPHAPNFAGYVTGEYSFPLFKGYQGSVAVAAHFTTGYDFIAGAGGPLGLDKQKGYALVNINGWLTPDTGRWRVGFYIDNATNSKYYDFATTAAPYGAYDQPAEPLTFGMKLRYNLENWGG